MERKKSFTLFPDARLWCHLMKWCSSELRGEKEVFHHNTRTHDFGTSLECPCKENSLLFKKNVYQWNRMQRRLWTNDAMCFHPSEPLAERIACSVLTCLFTHSSLRSPILPMRGPFGELLLSLKVLKHLRPKLHLLPYEQAHSFKVCFHGTALQVPSGDRVFLWYFPIEGMSSLMRLA